MINRLKALLPEGRVLSDSGALKTYGKDWLTDFKPDPLCIVLPESEPEVQTILSFCNEHGVSVVPSGGRTGLSGGATASNGELILSLERLNKFIEVNTTEQTITVDAGVVTERIQQLTAEQGLFFPIDFASKGSSQIGGNIATNVGGIRVIKYGNIRDWVLSLNVVLADGTAMTLNGELFKNNTGYDFRSLFIGSEGTLGIITRATLRLTEPPGDLCRILCGVTSLNSILHLLQAVRSEFSGLSAFEFFPRNGLEKVLLHHRLRDPFEESFPYYVLIELEGVTSVARESLEEFFCTLLEEETLAWVVMSQSQKQLEELLALRELLPETLSMLHTLHKNDISVPVSKIPLFIERFDQVIAENYPDYEVVTFGHIGDGNLHVNVLKPEGVSQEEFLTHAKQSDIRLFELVRDFNGSISAEHGVGLKKKAFLAYTRSPLEISLMQKVKQVFDPNGILNPGKIFDEVN